ncbi:MAG: hypothetical protein RLZZ44_239 [Bacteroidota bacterium]|jgi:hypothetical protein
MNRFLFIFFFIVSNLLYSQNEEAKQVVVSFFKGFHAKDSVVMKSACSTHMILQSISESAKGSKLKTESTSAFYKSIASIPSQLVFEEKLLDFRIQVDGDLAHIWTPYEFYINTKFSHKGVNAFTLFKDNGQWKIIHLIDTRHK